MLLSKLRIIDVRMYKRTQLLNAKCWRLTITAPRPLNAEMENHILQVRRIKLLEYCCSCWRLSLGILAHFLWIFHIHLVSFHHSNADWFYISKGGGWGLEPKVMKSRPGDPRQKRHHTVFACENNHNTTGKKTRREKKKNSTSLTLQADNSGQVCH